MNPAQLNLLVIFCELSNNCSLMTLAWPLAWYCAVYMRVNYAIIISIVLSRCTLWLMILFMHLMLFEINRNALSVQCTLEWNVQMYKIQTEAHIKRTANEHTAEREKTETHAHKRRDEREAREKEEKIWWIILEWLLLLLFFFLFCVNNDRHFLNVL